jgi:hypothetical protein
MMVSQTRQPMGGFLRGFELREPVRARPLLTLLVPLAVFGFAAIPF